MGADRKRGETFLNYVVPPAYGDAQGFQAGSTFKAFVLAAAIDQGIGLRTRIRAPNRVSIPVSRYTGCNGRLRSTEVWRPRNSTGAGTFNLYTGTRQSVNTFYAQLELRTGLCQPYRLAKQMGIALTDPDRQQIPAFTLGVAETNPLSMAEAYATFANRGVHCDPIIIESVSSKSGRKIEVPSANCTKVMEPQIADGVSMILKSVINNGTARRAHLNDSRDQAAKTGTTNSAEAVWLAGYTPDMAGVAMIAADKQAPQYKGREIRSITGRCAHGTDYGGGCHVLEGSGSGDAGMIWKGAMTAALEGVEEPGRFVKPSDEILEGKKAELPDISGKRMKDAMAAVEAAGFGTAVVERYSSTSAAGTYLGAWPTSGTWPLGRTVEFYVSAGPRPQPRPTATATRRSITPSRPQATRTSRPTRTATAKPKATQTTSKPKPKPSKSTTKPKATSKPTSKRTP